MFWGREAQRLTFTLVAVGAIFDIHIYVGDCIRINKDAHAFMQTDTCKGTNALMRIQFRYEHTNTERHTWK